MSKRVRTSLCHINVAVHHLGCFRRLVNTMLMRKDGEDMQISAPDEIAKVDVLSDDARSEKYRTYRREYDSTWSMGLEYQRRRTQRALDVSEMLAERARGLKDRLHWLTATPITLPLWMHASNLSVQLVLSGNTWPDPFHPDPVCLSAANLAAVLCTDRGGATQLDGATRPNREEKRRNQANIGAKQSPRTRVSSQGDDDSETGVDDTGGCDVERDDESPTGKSESGNNSGDSNSGLFARRSSSRGRGRAKSSRPIVGKAKSDSQGSKRPQKKRRRGDILKNHKRSPSTRQRRLSGYIDDQAVESGAEGCFEPDRDEAENNTTRYALLKQDEHNAGLARDDTDDQSSAESEMDAEDLDPFPPHRAQAEERPNLHDTRRMKCRALKSSLHGSVILRGAEYTDVLGCQVPTLFAPTMFTRVRDSPHTVVECVFTRKSSCGDWNRSCSKMTHLECLPFSGFVYRPHGWVCRKHAYRKCDGVISNARPSNLFTGPGQCVTALSKAGETKGKLISIYFDETDAKWQRIAADVREPSVPSTVLNTSHAGNSIVFSDSPQISVPLGVDASEMSVESNCLKSFVERASALPEPVLPSTSDSYILTSIGGVDLNVSSYNTTKDTVWLNDTVLNFFLSLMERWYRRKGVKVRIMNTHFISMLIGPFGNEYNYGAAKMFCSGIALSHEDLIIVPVFTQRPCKHWALAVLYPQLRRIEFRDSLGNTGVPVMNCLLKYFLQRIGGLPEIGAVGRQSKKRKTNSTVNLENQCDRFILDPGEWELRDRLRDCAQQAEGHECGVMLAMNAEATVAGYVLHKQAGSRQETDAYRKIIRCALLNTTGFAFVPTMLEAVGPVVPGSVSVRSGRKLGGQIFISDDECGSPPRQSSQHMNVFQRRITATQCAGSVPSGGDSTRSNQSAATPAAAESHKRSKAEAIETGRSPLGKRSVGGVETMSSGVVARSLSSDFDTADTTDRGMYALLIHLSPIHF
jgi:hypothetical protein